MGSTIIILVLILVCVFSLFIAFQAFKLATEEKKARKEYEAKIEKEHKIDEQTVEQINNVVNGNVDNAFNAGADVLHQLSEKRKQ